MKNIKRKVIAILLILVMAVAIFPNVKVNAIVNVDNIIVNQDGTLSIENQGNLEDRGVSQNGVYFMADYIYEKYPESQVHLIVTDEDMNVGATLVGFEGQIAFEGVETIISVQVVQGDWNVVSKIDNENKCVNFVVEPNDLENFQENPHIIVKYKFDKNAESHYAYINKNTFKKTDLYNNVYNSLASVTEDFDVKLETNLYAPVVSKDSRVAQIFGDKIFAKLEGKSIGGEDGVVIDALDLVDMLGIMSEKCTSFIIVTDNEQVLVQKNDQGIFEIPEKIMKSGNEIHFAVFDRDVTDLPLSFDYKVIPMGNVYYDDVSNGDVINIKDVMALRQAIVGMEEILNDPNYHVEASDVNFSNDELGTTGDIGDIISIRQRILNYYWLDK